MTEATKIPTKYLPNFFHQISDMILAGVPLTAALKALSDTQNKSIRQSANL